MIPWYNENSFLFVECPFFVVVLGPINEFKCQRTSQLSVNPGKWTPTTMN